MDSAPEWGFFHGHLAQPNNKAAAEDDPKPPQHTVENKRKQPLLLGRWFSTCCEDVENKPLLPIL